MAAFPSQVFGRNWSGHSHPTELRGQCQCLQYPNKPFGGYGYMITVYVQNRSHDDLALDPHMSVEDNVVNPD